MKITIRRATPERNLVGVYNSSNYWTLFGEEVWWIPVSVFGPRKSAVYGTLEEVLKGVVDTKPIYEGDTLEIVF